MAAARRRDRHPVAAALDRIRARRMVQRTGALHEPPVPLPTDTREVRQLLSGTELDQLLRAPAGEQRRDLEAVRSEAATYLREMAASHEGRSEANWRRFSRWALRAYDLHVDEAAIARLKAIDKDTSLAFLFSHRSYLDGMLLPEALAQYNFEPTFTFGGANLNFFPVGQWVSRTGIIFIRRDTKDLPVYRIALRAYIAQLLRNRANLTWSIEGGRTRTGKLRPPMYGILRYIADGLEDAPGNEVQLVPVSIMYDQLHEVSLMTKEAHGGKKKPEDLRWMVKLSRQQKHRLGRAYLDFGEPVPLRQRLAELGADPATSGTEIERIAIDMSHRINRATPVTATAVTTLALLGAGRALNIDEVLATVHPLAAYIALRQWKVAGAADLTDRATIERALAELVSSAVLTRFDEGMEPVWSIGADKHLVAAFYRNSMIHILVDRAIAELALQAAAEGGGDTPGALYDEAMQLRELLKFDFFFSGRATFEEEMAGELRLLGAPDATDGTLPPADARRLLEDADVLLAHQVLRPFLDAYHVVACVLAAHDARNLDEKTFFDACLRLGKQWQLQRRIASAESVSLELFKGALRLARYRGLVDGDDLTTRRKEFVAELAANCRRAHRIAELARERSIF